MFCFLSIFDLYSGYDFFPKDPFQKIYTWMAYTLESIALTIHCCSASLSLMISGLLVYAVFVHTPPIFSAFGTMLKFHALVDFYVAIGYSACVQR